MPIPNPTEKAKRRRTSSFFKEESSSLHNGSPVGEEEDQNGYSRRAQEPVLLVCLVNKKTGDKFDEKDEKIVRECFQ